ncbi:MAG: hypothetical protein ABI861_09340 [Panacibacter sp.]
MKSNTKGFRITGFIIIAIVMLSCAQKKAKPPKGFEKVEAPKVAYSDLKNPEPVLVKQNLPIEKVQLGNHGFLFLSAGKPLSEDVSQIGTISSISDKDLIIKSTEKGDITMRYALPANLRMPVKAGERLSINYSKRFYGNSVGYTLSNYVGEQLIHASCKISNADTIRVELLKGVFIYQLLSKQVEEKKSDFGTIRDIPVYLSVNGRSMQLATGKEQEVNIYDAKFIVFVLVSTEMQSSEEKRASSEGDGFTLEYAIVKK